MSEFIIPPKDIEEIDNPVVFLAGPVQGSKNWQAKAAFKLMKDSPRDISIISPRGNPRLYEEPSEWLADGRQTPWEKHYLRLARDKGVLAVWLAEQTYTTPGRVHTQTTRIEFGRIAGWLDYNPEIPFVFGVSPSYRSGNQAYMEEVCEELDIPIQRSLASWCDSIVEKVEKLGS